MKAYSRIIYEDHIGKESVLRATNECRKRKDWSEGQKREMNQGNMAPYLSRVQKVFPTSNVMVPWQSR